MQKGCKRFKELVALIQETPEYMTISEANKVIMSSLCKPIPSLGSSSKSSRSNRG